MASDLEVVNAADIGRDAWDDLADASRDAWLWHRYDYTVAVGCWETRTHASFGLVEEGELRAIVPVTVDVRRAASIVRYPVLDSQGGPALCSDLAPKTRRRILNGAMAELRRRATVVRAAEALVSLTPLSPVMQEEDPRVNPLLEFADETVAGQTWVLDLPSEREEMWDGLEGRARTAVRKARRNEVQVRLSEGSDEDVESYYQLHRLTYGRTGARPHPPEYFQRIWEQFVASGLARVYFAEHDGTAVAAQNFGWYKSAALYWTGASSEAALRLGANNLLLWTAMVDMHADGISRFEVGEAFSAKHGAKARGLSDFKASMGGALHPVFRTRLDTASLAQRAVRSARELVR